MKKFLFVLAAVAALFTACTKENPYEAENNAIAQELQVNAYLASAGTKATNAVTNTTTDDLASFIMSAYSDDKDVMTSAVYTKGADKKWSTSNIYYWNSVGKYEFFAIAENNKTVGNFSGGTTSVTKDGLTIGSATAPFKVKTSGAQSDPVYAAKEATTVPTTGTIDLVFEHILARVNVEPTISIDAKYQLKATVKSWEFRGVGIEGTVTNATTASNVGWTTTKTGNVTNDYEKGKVSWNNVIPGEKVVDTLVLKVTFYDNNGVEIKDRYFTVAKDKITNAVKKYDQGYQYTYKLKVTNDGGPDTDGPDGPDSPLLKIEVAGVTVTPWQTTTGGEFEFKNK